MVFTKCMTCRVLTTLFILLICASLYFRKKNVLNFRRKKVLKIKENLVSNEPSKEIIAQCEEQNLKNIIDSGNQSGKTGKTEESANAQCIHFLKDKCTYENCKTGIEVYPFTMDNKEDSKSFAQSCGALCDTRCNTIKMCARLKSNKDPYNVSINSDSVNE